MKVSVIVPVYNAEQYLDQCLESLTNQTLKDIEIICVDNCSTDKSRAIITEWSKRDSRIRVFFNGHNLTQAGSMNVGLEASTGEYVAECDSDDWVAANMYERLYNVATMHDCDVVQCGFYDCAGDTKTERQPFTKFYVGNPLADLRGMDLMLFLGWQCHIQSAIYKRSFLIDNDIRYRVGHNFEDTALTFKIRTTGRPYAFVPECLYYYRTDNQQSGAHTIVDAYAICEQYNEIMRWNNEHNLGLDLIIGVLRFYSYRWSASRIKDEDTLREFWLRAGEDFAKDMTYSGFFLTKEDYEMYQAVLMTALPAH